VRKHGAQTRANNTNITLQGMSALDSKCCTRARLSVNTSRDDSHTVTNGEVSPSYTASPTQQRNTHNDAQTPRTPLFHHPTLVARARCLASLCSPSPPPMNVLKAIKIHSSTHASTPNNRY